MTTYTVYPLTKPVAIYAVRDNTTAEVGRLKLGQSTTGALEVDGWINVKVPGASITGWLESKNCRVVISESVPEPPSPPAPPDPAPVNTTISFYVEIDEVKKEWTFASINGQEVILKPSAPTAG